MKQVSCGFCFNMCMVLVTNMQCQNITLVKKNIFVVPEFLSINVNLKRKPNVSCNMKEQPIGWKTVKVTLEQAMKAQKGSRL